MYILYISLKKEKNSSCKERFISQTQIFIHYFACCFEFDTKIFLLDHFEAMKMNSDLQK